MKKERVQAGGREYELEVVSAEDGRLRARIDGEEVEMAYSVCAPGVVKVGAQVIRFAAVEGGRQVAAAGCHVSPPSVLRQRPSLKIRPSLAKSGEKATTPGGRPVSVQVSPPSVARSRL